MAGIFGIIGDISQSKKFENTVLHLNNYKSNSIKINEKTFLGLTSLDFMNIDILEKENLIISLNGEYYTEKMNATSSREMIFDLFKKHGKNFIHQLDGIFNIFIFDKSENKLLLFNDWAGNHNLFYYFNGKNFIFSTEIKGIMKIIDKKTIDKKAVISQIMFSHLLFDYSLVEEIKLLDPGSILEFQDGNLKIENYFDLKNVYKLEDEKKASYYIEKLYYLFEEPTKKYLHKNNISLPLTGGMDSRLLLHFLMKYQYDIKDIYTLNVLDVHKEDVEIAELICKKNNLPFRNEKISFDYFKNNFFKNYELFDGCLPQILYGSGHEITREHKCEYIIQYPSPNLTLGDLFTPNTKNFIGNYKLNDFIKNKIFNKFLKVQESVIQKLFHKDYWQFENVKQEIFNFFDSLNEFPSIYIFDYFSWYQHCRRWSNIGGINGQFIGRIAPSQDKKLIEFCFNIPAKLKYWQYIHKKMFKTKCPELAKFPREGTGVPISWNEKIQMLFKAYRNTFKPKLTKSNKSRSIDNFYRNFVREEIESIIFSKNIKERKVFNIDYLEQLWNDHLNGKNNSYILHNVINIEMYHKNLID
jgi:asparagine synthase (glutamine-hydrolysing)